MTIGQAMKADEGFKAAKSLLEAQKLGQEKAAAGGGDMYPLPFQAMDPPEQCSPLMMPTLAMSRFWHLWHSWHLWKDIHPGSHKLQRMEESARLEELESRFRTVPRFMEHHEILLSEGETMHQLAFIFRSRARIRQQKVENARIVKANQPQAKIFSRSKSDRFEYDNFISPCFVAVFWLKWNSLMLVLFPKTKNWNKDPTFSKQPLIHISLCNVMSRLPQKSGMSCISFGDVRCVSHPL